MSTTEAGRWGEIFAELHEHLWPMLRAWVASGSYVAEGGTDYPVVSEFTDRYVGHWGSFREHAEAMADDIGLLNDVPEGIARYFDWAKWVEDQRHDYLVCDAPASEGYGVYIFRSP